MVSKLYLKMRYIPACASGQISVRKCARLIGIAPYSVTRLKKRFKEMGDAIWVHGNTGRAPKNKKYDHAKIAADYKLFEGTPFASFRDDCADYLHYSALPSYTTIHTVLSSAGIISPLARIPVREKKLHLPRPERSNEGDLIQIDGSTHDWFMNGHKVCLHGAVDDSTHKIVALYFCTNECLLGYYQLLWQVFLRTADYVLTVTPSNTNNSTPSTSYTWAIINKQRTYCTYTWNGQRNKGWIVNWNMRGY